MLATGRNLHDVNCWFLSRRQDSRRLSSALLCKKTGRVVPETSVRGSLSRRPKHRHRDIAASFGDRFERSVAMIRPLIARAAPLTRGRVSRDDRIHTLQRAFLTGMQRSSNTGHNSTGTDATKLVRLVFVCSIAAASRRNLSRFE
jgi:hypothetical protein